MVSKALEEKRGCGIIRDRCQQYILGLKRLGYDNSLPLEKAKELFMEILDIYDRTSLKAYFGTVPGRCDRKIMRWARYMRTGTTSPKEIVLSQDIPKRVGYLERLQLIGFEQRGKTWFILLKNPMLVPQLMKAKVSMENISLPLKHLSPESASELPIARSTLEAPEGTHSVETTNNNNNCRVREKSFFSMDYARTMPLSIFTHNTRNGKGD
jgi:hypothetical protein